MNLPILVKDLVYIEKQNYHIFFRKWAVDVVFKSALDYGNVISMYTF